MYLMQKDMPLRVEAVADAGTFKGYGSVFNTVDAYGDTVLAGAFAKSLANFRANNRSPAMLWQHDKSDPIGVWESAAEDSRGLLLEGRLLVDDIAKAREARAHLKAGSIDGLSIGFGVEDSGVEFDKKNGGFLIREVELYEVSLVTFPANAAARVDMTSVKRAADAGELTPKLVERALRDVGLSRQQAKAFMSEGYKGISPRDAADTLESLGNLINTLS